MRLGPNTLQRIGSLRVSETKPLTFKATQANLDILIDNNLRPNLKAWIAANGDYEITIRPYKSKRSIEQNKRLWKIYQVIAECVWVEGRRFSSEVWHEHFKGLYLGFEEIELPSGEVLKRPISTANLKTGDMTAYQDMIQSWAADNYSIQWEF